MYYMPFLQFLEFHFPYLQTCKSLFQVMIFFVKDLCLEIEQGSKVDNSRSKELFL